MAREVPNMQIQAHIPVPMPRAAYSAEGVEGDEPTQTMPLAIVSEQELTGGGYLQPHLRRVTRMR